MQKQIKILLTILMALALAVSCAKNNPNDPNNTTKTKEQMLQQKWEYATYAGSGYNITADRVDDWTGTAVNYSVAIKEIVWNADNTSGIIYGQYTSHSDTTLVNKYYAIAFQNLTETTIEIAGAYKSGGVSETDTLEQAKTTFTVDNGYFSYSKLNVVK